MKLGINLQKKAIFIVAGILFFTLSTNTFVLTYIAAKRYERAILSKATAVGEDIQIALGKVLNLGVALESFEGVNEKLKELVSREETIGYAMVMDSTGKILFHNEQNAIGKELKDKASLKAISSDKILIQIVGSFYDLSFPLLNAEGKMVGALRVGVYSKAVKSQVYELMFWALGISAICFLLSLGLVYIFISKFITQSIIELRDVAIEIAKGDLDKKIKVRANDEIGQLGVAFNKMGEDLKKLLQREKELAADAAVSRDYVDNIIKSMIDTLIVIDPEGKIRTVNKATCDLLGYKEEELIGKPVEMIFEEEEILNEIEESAILVSKDFRIIKANNAFLREYGLTRKDVINQLCYKITHNRDSICEQPNDICPIEELLEGHGSCVGLHTHLNKEWKEVSVNIIAAPIKSKSGEIYCYLHLAREVKKEEEKGRLSQEDLEKINELTDKLVTYATRLEEEKVLTKGAIEILGRGGAVKDLEMYYKTKSGEIIPVSFSGSAMQDKEGNLSGIVGVARDMREIKKFLQKEKELAAAATEAAEKEKAKAKELEKAYRELRDTQIMLVQSEKLSALGELGAGVAHELNSPLAGVLSLIRTYLKEKDLHSEEYQDFKDIEEACEHMAKIIKDFSSFTRKSTGELADVNIIDVIETTLSFSARQIEKQGVKIEKDYDNNLPLIKGDESQLRQVVLNMVTNARDAISGEGTLRITTRRNDTEKGQFVEMAFSDTGNGISKEDIGKIFDPFFTTKRPGRGVGLGLSITHTIVKNHNGEILVDSELGKGTTFTIRLPVATE